MKHFYYTRLWLLLAVVAIVLPVGALKREQRATWMSAYTGCWPTSAITSGSADAHKRICEANLDTLQRNNFTTIYYHVRTMCDAMYDSKYEPWSSYVSGTRGVAPAFDPLDYLLTSAHTRGIEVYAWLNPYRYINSSLYDSYGDAGGDKNYENSHPEWLIKWETEGRTWTILNPALQEVKQRIVDVIADILEKYDVDGIVFDDYFYQQGLPMDYDAADYKKYTDAGGSLSQADWRRENVNDMVRMVNDYIKSVKPWVRFGISPAGVAMGNNLASIAGEKYGVTPCPGSDWQYDGIYSDPLAWLQAGTIDFISPQVYWRIGNTAADYGKITPWWYTVASKFNRHCYISQSLSSRSGDDFADLLEEIDLTRTSVENSDPGTVYFPWKTLKALSMKENRKNVYLSNYLRMNTFQTSALSPMVTWVDASYPGTASSVVRNGRTISWEGPDNVRFTIYAVPKSVGMSGFHKEEEYLRGISYEKSFEIPTYDSNYPEFGIADADLDNYLYAVATYDRYGNEYSAVFEGQTVGASETPELKFPVDGETAPGAFNFSWEGSAAVYEITVAADAAMKDVIVRKEVTGNYVAAADLAGFSSNTTYYWQVVARDNNTTDARSSVESFMVDVFRITSPASEAVGVSLTPTVEWVSVGEGASYTLQLATDSSFGKVVYETTTTETAVTVPVYTLVGNTTYYARVLVDGGVSETSWFTTKSVTPAVPVLESPATDGVTLNSNSVISVEPVEGVAITRIMVSEKNTFPVRTSYNGLFSTGIFETPQLSDEVFTKYLTSSGEYYARACFQYVGEDGATATTDWCRPVSFNYDASAGVASMRTEDIYAIGGNDARLVAGRSGLVAEVYTADGRLALSVATDASGMASLSGLPDGAYLIVVKVDDKIETLKFLK